MQVNLYSQSVRGKVFEGKIKTPLHRAGLYRGARRRERVYWSVLVSFFIQRPWKKPRPLPGRPVFQTVLKLPRVTRS